MNGTLEKKRMSNVLTESVKEIVAGSQDTPEKLLAICTLLSGTVPYYD